MRKSAVLNGSRAIPGVLQTMDVDFWKEWGESRAALARIEERAGHHSATLLRIERSETALARKIADVEKTQGEMNRRFEAIEGKGIAAWGPRRVAQLAGVVAMMGAIFGGVFGAVNWLIAHYK